MWCPRSLEAAAAHTERLSSRKLKHEASKNIFHRLFLFVHPPPCWSNIHSNTMATVVDTKLYDILGVTPNATENELKKVITLKGLNKPRNYTKFMFVSVNCYNQEMRCYAQQAS